MSYQHTNPMGIPKSKRRAELALYAEDDEAATEEFLLSTDPTPHQVQTALMVFALGDDKPSAKLEILQHLALLGILNRLFDDAENWFTFSHMLAMMGDGEIDEVTYMLIVSTAMALGMKSHQVNKRGQSAEDVAQELGNVTFLRSAREGFFPTTSKTLCLD